jgi:predicted Zn-dependent protease
VVVTVAGLCREATAASLIRDAEIERTIRSYAAPLFEAAGLNANDIRIYIINDDSLNAFVAGGMNLFIHTGLLLRSRNAGEVIGVIAHETGHIAGGHLARLSNQIETGSKAALVATILGILTAVATGSGGAGAAVAHGGQGLAVGTILNFTRAQEAAADQAALRLLDATQQSADGLASFLETIEDQELLTPQQQDAYARTHPITRDRIEHIRQHLARSPNAGKPVRPEFAEMHRRMLAKLNGFIAPPATTLRRYKEDDRTLAARYARAVAQFRLADIDRALALVDGLIREEPGNAYFHELKGQILFESGRIAESVAPNREAVRLDSESALLRIGLARSLVESHDPATLDDAIAHLLYATRAEPDNAFAWDQLAIAYGRDGQLGLSALAQAEASLARGNSKDTLSHAARAEKRLKKGSAAWLRLEDIKRAAKDLQRERN